MTMLWTALAGGVGGAKLARGLAAIAPDRADELRIVVNTGDDFTLHGLRISPDLDTVLYTLAGIANPETGWGIAGDTFVVMEQLGRLGGPTWFSLGDHDLATHITRTALMRSGATLAQVTDHLALALGVSAPLRLVPMSDDLVATQVETPDGWLDFQDYFVRRHHADEVRGVRFAGVEEAAPHPLALDGVSEASLVVLCPSNPIVSIGPVLALRGMRAALAQERVGRCRVAVSPIVGGKALRGPADRMLEGLGHEVSALGVARLYVGLIDLFVLDITDAALAPDIAALGMQPVVAQTVMASPADSRALAEAILEAAQTAGLAD
jgi:LPPG:FO 2-phospho-L-lactate transferase